MFPWLMPNATMGGNLSLLSMLQGGGASGPYGSMFQPGYWDRFNAARRSGEDRSDQSGNQNQPDTNNAMAPPGQTPRGGPDNTAMSGYDPNTVGPQSFGGYDPGWMRMLAGLGGASRRPNMNQALGMGGFGLSMLQPRPPTRVGPYPWI